MKPILEFCPNVINIEFYEFSVLSNEDKNFLPKLEHIISEFKISSHNIEGIVILVNKYSKSLKTFNFFIYNTTEEVLKTCTERISRFEKLNGIETPYRFPRNGRTNR